jgi:putative transposase
MEASDIKKMFADLSLECRVLKDVIEKALKPAIKRELVGYLTTQFTMSVPPGLRDIIDEQVTRTLNEAPEITGRWLYEYNSEQPHESLNNLTPEEY